MQHSGSQRSINAQDEAYSRMISDLQREAQKAQQIKEYNSKMLEDAFSNEQKKKQQRKQKVRALNEDIVSQIEENHAKRQILRADKLVPGLDPNFHGYPHRPETPPQERRKNELKVAAKFKHDLDDHMNMLYDAKEKEDAAENYYRLKFIERNNQELKQEKVNAQAKKDKERKLLEDGRQFSEKTKEMIDYIGEIQHKGTAHRPVPRAFIEQQSYSNIPRSDLKLDTKEPMLKELKEEDEKIRIKRPSQEYPQTTKNEMIASPTAALSPQITIKVKEPSNVRNPEQPPPPMSPPITPILSKTEQRKKRAMEIKARLDKLYPKKEIRNKPDYFYMHKPETPEEIRIRRSRRAKEAIRKEIDRLRLKPSQTQRVIPTTTKAVLPQRKSPNPRIKPRNPFEDHETWLDKKKETLRRSIASQLDELEKLGVSIPSKNSPRQIKEPDFFVTQSVEPAVKLPDINSRGALNSTRSMHSLRSSQRTGSLRAKAASVLSNR